jgi:hypothetical protein
MRRSADVITSAAWFVVTGGVGAVLVPSWLTGWRLRHPLPYWSVAEAVGILMIVVSRGARLASPATPLDPRRSGHPRPRDQRGDLSRRRPRRFSRFGAEDVDGGSAGTDPQRQRRQRVEGEHPGKREASSEEADGSAVVLGGDERLREHASAAMAGR